MAPITTSANVSTRPELAQSSTGYTRYLILIAGLGGLLYGIDVGIISAALLYLGKTIHLSLAQTSWIVAAVLGGSMFSSLIAGVLADWFGRKAMMIVSGLLFVTSVLIITSSQGFAGLLAGRLLQGLSGGVIAVVVPLYLAESLRPASRGRGSAIFQLMLTVGIVIAAATGWYFTHQADIAIAAAHNDAALVLKAENHVWRGMFLSVIYPGVLFLVGTFWLSESPRWLFRKGRDEDARRALRRSCSESEAELQMEEMRSLTGNSEAQQTKGQRDPLLQRKYVLPFLLACVILACNQTTGINSVLGYLVIILKQAGLSVTHATQGDFVVKLLNCLMTLVAVALVDRYGRKFLLVLGTAGIIVALTAGAVLFRTAESHRADVQGPLGTLVRSNGLDVPFAQLATADSATGPTVLTVLYSYGSGEQLATVLSTDPDPVLRIHPDGVAHPSPLVIRSATLSLIPSEHTGWLIAACLALFIASFAVGPGVVVWLALSELMPTRIRSAGMGIALLINQGVSTLIAGVFLPTVSHFGYSTMFALWAGCTVIYFLTAVFFLPETKGKSLEEIELSFSVKQTAR